MEVLFLRAIDSGKLKFFKHKDYKLACVDLGVGDETFTDDAIVGTFDYFHGEIGGGGGVGDSYVKGDVARVEVGLSKGWLGVEGRKRRK